MFREEPPAPGGLPFRPSLDPMTSPGDDLPWHRQERHIAVLLRTHPLLEGLPVAVAGNEHAIDAVIQDQDGEDLVGVRIEAEGWWEPAIPARGAALAEQLANALLDQWRNRSGR